MIASLSLTTSGDFVSSDSFAIIGLFVYTFSLVCLSCLTYFSTFPPFLVAFKGHPATGKSVLAEALARRLHWPLVDKDDVKDHLLHLPGCNELAYAIMWQIAGTQLALGTTPSPYPRSPTPRNTSRR